MAKMTPTKLRKQLLREKGLTDVATTIHHHIHPAIQPVDPKLKTPLMKYLELVYGEPIEDLLMSGSETEVARKLDNQVDVTTISKWIKKLRLRYGKDNLPKCDGCRRRTPTCDAGFCLILGDLGLYSLLDVKRKEMFE
mgnify:FL=1